MAAKVFQICFSSFFTVAFNNMRPNNMLSQLNIFGALALGTPLPSALVYHVNLTEIATTTSSSFSPVQDKHISIVNRAMHSLM